jgi:hypothetical protein
MKTLEIRTNNGRDIYADFECVCPSDLFKDSPIAHIMKQRILLAGYNDDYFFDVVNKEPREHECKCGIKRLVQWTRDGVIVQENKGGRDE